MSAQHKDGSAVGGGRSADWNGTSALDLVVDLGLEVAGLTLPHSELVVPGAQTKGRRREKKKRSG